MEQFWRHYCHIARPSDLTGHTDYHLFKEGIRPMWEVCMCSILFFLFCAQAGFSLKTNC